jgi:UDP-2,3-diacylglucosamine pyrophosphatase LpxH
MPRELAVRANEIPEHGDNGGLSRKSNQMRCGNDDMWTAMENAKAFSTPAHIPWITLRVIHIPTTTATANSLRTLKEKPKTKSNLQIILDTTKERGSVVP